MLTFHMFASSQPRRRSHPSLLCALGALCVKTNRQRRPVLSVDRHIPLSRPPLHLAASPMHNSFVFILFRTLTPSSQSQALCFQALPNSFCKTPGVYTLAARPRRRQTSSHPVPSTFNFRPSSHSRTAGQPQSLSPFFAALTSRSQQIENTTTLSLFLATLTQESRPKSLICHSYTKLRGVGVWERAKPAVGFSRTLTSLLLYFLTLAFSGATRRRSIIAAKQSRNRRRLNHMPDHRPEQRLSGSRRPRRKLRQVQRNVQSIHCEQIMMNPVRHDSRRRTRPRIAHIPGVIRDLRIRRCRHSCILRQLRHIRRDVVHPPVRKIRRNVIRHHGIALGPRQCGRPVQLWRHVPADAHAAQRPVEHHARRNRPVILKGSACHAKQRRRSLLRSSRASRAGRSSPWPSFTGKHHQIHQRKQGKAQQDSRLHSPSPSHQKGPPRLRHKVRHQKVPTTRVSAILGPRPAPVNRVPSRFLRPAVSPLRLGLSASARKPRSRKAFSPSAKSCSRAPHANVFHQAFLAVKSAILFALCTT
jgi:hypothetical protein